MQPSLLRGEHDGIALLSQYNAHGLFIALEELGYILLSVALASIAPVFAGAGRVRTTLRYVLTRTFVSTVLAFGAIATSYGFDREYRAEIAVITIACSSLMVCSVLLSLVFHEQLREPPDERELRAT